MADRSPAGPGRVLTLLYAFFTLAAGARSAVQLLTHAGQAPLAYGLSAGAAVIYLIGTVTIARTDRTPARRRAATVLCLTELTGVLTVGVLSIARPASFPDDTVWSRFGSGYGWVPLILPVAALIWLSRMRAATPEIEKDPASTVT